MKRLLDNVQKENAALQSDLSRKDGGAVEMQRLLDDLQKENSSLHADLAQKANVSSEMRRLQDNLEKLQWWHHLCEKLSICNKKSMLHVAPPRADSSKGCLLAFQKPTRQMFFSYFFANICPRICFPKNSTKIVQPDFVTTHWDLVDILGETDFLSRHLQVWDVCVVFLAVRSPGFTLTFSRDGTVGRTLRSIQT